MVSVTLPPVDIRQLTYPYKSNSLCYGTNREIIKLLEDGTKKHFALIRFEPITTISSESFEPVFTDLIPRLCQLRNLRRPPKIGRLVDLHLYTEWKYPVLIVLAGETVRKLNSDLNKFLKIIKTCL